MHAPQVSDPHVERTRKFQAIYRREFEFVWASARRFGVPPEAVDDAVQEVFLTAYRRLDHLEYEVSPRGWLYGVTRRIAARYRRSASRRARRAEALQLVWPPPASPHQRVDAAQQLDHLLGGLGPGNRVVFEMVELLGMSGPEVAAELGEPLNTVYSRLRLARAQLQALVSPPELAAGVAAARERDAPPPEAARRNWALVSPLLGKPAGGAGLGAWLTARAGFATTLVVAAGAALVLTIARGGPERPAPADRTPTIRAVTTSAISAPASPSGPDALAREVALLDQARLAADVPAQALELLAAHAREFPRGALADAREAARVEALCRQGQVDAAESAARALLAEHPGSAIARRHENYRCTADGPRQVPGK
ncbi:sigma-70 family RNA polymerase sigma factor [Nannocystis sp. SCPEA4]|uniref:sigma-70 family RNA polymerase sigma factor n=1 Tax=Nannocystis sp. SCPEA4 TaxID=2996787 RepID=UPI00226DB119|nr:sigma-70 family RNA polymerase sigma factor [Nannocystis sp. SCPEA4]MCY1059324.1 sigma-70 family RNA polymerase sigma factor [Nannocystis sp. SCPEA4]